jgi:hypothetical protein
MEELIMEKTMELENVQNGENVENVENVENQNINIENQNINTPSKKTRSRKVKDVNNVNTVVKSSIQESSKNQVNETPITTPTKINNKNKVKSNNKSKKRSLQERIELGLYRITKNYIPLLDVVSLVNTITSYSIVDVYDEETQRFTGFVECDGLFERLIRSLLIVDEVTDLQILEYVYNIENDEDALDFQADRAYEIYDLLKENGVIDDVESEVSNIEELYNDVDSKIYNKVNLTNSLSNVVERKLNSIMDMMSGFADKLPNQDNLSGLMEKLPSVLNGMDKDKLGMISKAIGFDMNVSESKNNRSNGNVSNFKKSYKRKR